MGSDQVTCWNRMHSVPNKFKFGNWLEKCFHLIFGLRIICVLRILSKLVFDFDYFKFFFSFFDTLPHGALPFEIVQNECREIFRNRTIVGHQLNSDFSVLKIKHPKVNIRDTAKYFVETYGRTPSLKLLVRDFLEVGFQSGEHSSVQDAQATMRIYTMHKKKWERELAAEKKGSLKKGEKLDKRMFVGNNNQKPKSHFQKAVEEEKVKIVEGRKKDAKIKEDKSIPRGFAPDDDGGDWLD